MEEKKLTITSKKYRGDSLVVSIRLPNDLVDTIDNITKNAGRTRNDIIQQCLEFSVDNLEIKWVERNNGYF